MHDERAAMGAALRLEDAFDRGLVERVRAQSIYRFRRESDELTFAQQCSSLFYLLLGYAKLLLKRHRRSLGTHCARPDEGSAAVAEQ